MEVELNRCYIRSNKTQGWIQGRVHHQIALQAFIEIRESTNRIEVPHEDGGNFIAHFQHINDKLSQYVDESGNRVDIMICKPTDFILKTGLINRVSDTGIASNYIRLNNFINQDTFHIGC